MWDLLAKIIVSLIVKLIGDWRHEQELKGEGRDQAIVQAEADEDARVAAAIAARNSVSDDPPNAGTK